MADGGSAVSDVPDDGKIATASARTTATDTTTGRQSDLACVNLFCDRLHGVAGTGCSSARNNAADAGAIVSAVSPRLVLLPGTHVSFGVPARICVER